MRYCIYSVETGKILRWTSYLEVPPAGYVCEERAFDARDGCIHNGVFVPRERTTEEKWAAVRAERAVRMNAFEWRINRYHRQVRMGDTPTDTLSELDAYMQALADVTLQADPDAIAWPQPPSS